MQVWIAASLLACTVALWMPMSRDRSRVRASFGFLALWSIATIVDFSGVMAHARDVADAFLILASIQIVAILAFEMALRKAGVPKFASEILIVASYVTVVFHLLYRTGVNVTGIFATSAVATAVIGLALQDMLSNIAGGIALELEGGIRPGDFVTCAEHAGWVQHVRLRHTAIRTPDGDTVFLPNSQLTRSPVHVSSLEHREFIPFLMAYAYRPQDVIETVEAALRASPMSGVLKQPAPRCIIQELAVGFVRYAAVVYTNVPGRDTDLYSTVLLRVQFALRRAGLPAGDISHMVEIRKPAANKGALSYDPVNVLRHTPILRLLEDTDIVNLAAELRHLSFAPGEHIIRQGDEGSSMYFVVKGDVSIAVRAEDGAERLVAAMAPGDFFGEATLLTGELRSASAIAKTQVDCYRLEKEALQHLMVRRVELAEDISVVMAHRQAELMQIREQLDRETALRREAENQTEMLARIRKFFGISANGAKA